MTFPLGDALCAGAGRLVFGGRVPAGARRTAEDALGAVPTAEAAPVTMDMSTGALAVEIGDSGGAIRAVAIACVPTAGSTGTLSGARMIMTATAAARARPIAANAGHTGRACDGGCTDVALPS